MSSLFAKEFWLFLAVVTFTSFITGAIPAMGSHSHSRCPVAMLGKLRRHHQRMVELRDRYRHQFGDAPTTEQRAFLATLDQFVSDAEWLVEDRKTDLARSRRSHFSPVNRIENYFRPRQPEELSQVLPLSEKNKLIAQVRSSEPPLVHRSDTVGVAVDAAIRRIRIAEELAPGGKFYETFLSNTGVRPEDALLELEITFYLVDSYQPFGEVREAFQKGLRNALSRSARDFVAEVRSGTRTAFTGRILDVMSLHSCRKGPALVADIVAFFEERKGNALDWTGYDLVREYLLHNDGDLAAIDSREQLLVFMSGLE